MPDSPRESQKRHPSTIRPHSLCRFTLEPETGTIWVRIGAEIETGASFSLNLSANFAAQSGESGLLFDCGLPGFDDGV